MKTIAPATRCDRRFKRRIIHQTIRYIVICLFLFFVNLYTSPHYWWVAWVAGGWGLDLLMNWLFHLTGCDEENDRETER